MDRLHTKNNKKAFLRTHFTGSNPRDETYTKHKYATLFLRGKIRMTDTHTQIIQARFHNSDAAKVNECLRYC